MTVTFRKASPAVASYVLYTADRPASWDVYVGGIRRGHIRGEVGQYSSHRIFRATVDGARLNSCGYGRLKDARRDVIAALAKAGS